MDTKTPIQASFLISGWTPDGTMEIIVYQPFHNHAKRLTQPNSTIKPIQNLQ